MYAFANNYCVINIREPVDGNVDRWQDGGSMAVAVALQPRQLLFSLQ